jgi:hypothetical protein
MLMRSIAVVLLFALPDLASLHAAHREPVAAAAIDRGLAFPAKDALAWKAQHQCVSCHHASMVVWAMREAKQLRGKRGLAEGSPGGAAESSPALQRWGGEGGRSVVLEGRLRARRFSRPSGTRDHPSKGPRHEGAVKVLPE